MLAVLRINGLFLLHSQRELVALGLGIADGSLSYEEILFWITAHIIE